MEENLPLTASGRRVDRICALCYLGPVYAGLVILMIEPTDTLVRFHAFQSTFAAAAPLLLAIYHLFPGKYYGHAYVLYAACSYFLLGRPAAKAAKTLVKAPFLPVLGPLAERYVMMNAIRPTPPARVWIPFALALVSEETFLQGATDAVDRGARLREEEEAEALTK